LTTERVFDVELLARVALEPDACPAFPPGVPEVVSPPLAAGRRIEQRLRVACHGLERLDVRTVTYGQELDQQLRLALRREDGLLVGEARLDAADAPDRAWLALDLDAAEPASGGRIYTLEIAAESARGSNAISFDLTSDDRAGDDVRCGAVGPALLDGVPVGGSLVLRGFAAWLDALREDDGPGVVAERAAGAAPEAPAQVRDRTAHLGAETWRA